MNPRLALLQTLLHKISFVTGRHLQRTENGVPLFQIEPFCLKIQSFKVDEDAVMLARKIFNRLQQRGSDPLAALLFVFDACIPGGIRPIVLIAGNPKDRIELKSGLSKIISVFRAVELIPSLPYPVCRERDSSYFCKRRYSNALTNGGVEAFAREPALYLAENGLDPKITKKICVKNCGGVSCSLSLVCGYLKLISSFRSGSVKMQIYTKRQYQLSVEEDGIPKRCVLIGIQAPSLDLAHRKMEYVLSERSFIDYAYLSTYHCNKAKNHRDQMVRHCKRFRKLTKQARYIIKWRDDNE